MKLKKAIKMISFASSSWCNIYNVEAALDDCDVFTGHVDKIPEKLLKKKCCYIMATGYRCYNIYISIRGIYL